MVLLELDVEYGILSRNGSTALTTIYALLLDAKGEIFLCLKLGDTYRLSGYDPKFSFGPLVKNPSNLKTFQLYD